MARQGSRRTWHRLTPETAAAHLAAWRRSGKTLAEFSVEAGLSHARLRRWQARLGTSEIAERPAFVPIRVLEAEPRVADAPAASLEIYAPGGLRVVVPQDFDAGALERLLRAVRRAAC
jgi:hypothetical protein